MLTLEVRDDAYGLDEASAREVLRRVEAAIPSEVEGELQARSTLDRLRGAERAAEPVFLDDGDLAVVGIVLDAWFAERDGDLPDDALELRHAVAAALS